MRTNFLGQRSTPVAPRPAPQPAPVTPENGSRLTGTWGPSLYAAGSVAGFMSIGVASVNVARDPRVKYTWTALLLGTSHLLKLKYYVDKPVAFWINAVNALGWLGVCVVSTSL